MRDPRPLLLALSLTAWGSGAALAQSDLSIRAARRDTITATSTVTAAFMIANGGADTLTVRTTLELPSEWTALTGGDSIVVPPGSDEMLILSLVVPGRTLAGTFIVRVRAAASGRAEGVQDSVIVRVPRRTLTEVTLLDRPGYVVSGRGYETGFEIRNRGNTPTELRLSARSSVSTATLSDSVVRLRPNESQVVRARMRTPAGINAAVDDVVEVIATHGGKSDEIRGSARVTVVPEPSRAIENFLRVPARVSVRAATSEGVSPFEALGSGLIRDGGSARLNFLARGPVGAASAFGEREEYRVELRHPAWRLRGGDHFYSLSPLTTSGQPGFGAGVDGDYAMFSAGAFSQQFRMATEGGREHAAFVGVRPTERARATLNLVERSGGALPGSVASASAELQHAGIAADMEYASSRTASGTGTARHARVTGATGRLSFDAGHLFADTGFGGAQRGAEHNYLTGNLARMGFVALGFNTSRHRTDLSRSVGVPYVERFRTAALNATLWERFTLEAGNVGRGTTIDAVRADGEQWSLRGRADHYLGTLTLTLDAEAGRSRDALATSRYTDLSLGARRTFAWGQAGGYLQRYSGGSLTKGAFAARTLGGDATLRVGRQTNATLMGYATRQETANAEWHSQLDGLVSRGLPNGSIVTLRARLVGGGSRSGSQQSVMYLEYAMPLRLPVAPLRTPGRVTGRVVDAVSGRGVPGALVRLGPQVAITDRHGEVSFGGVPGGQHRLSMSQETSFANAVFVGDPTLVVDSTRVSPTRFSLAIARSARIDVDVRRFSAVRTAVGQGADSVREVGAVSNAMLVLAGERDTLYRSTGESGKVSFTDVPPGKWTLSIRGDMPAFTRFEPDRVELVLAPGESAAHTFNLVPRRREVQMIGEGEELRPTTADPKVALPGAPGTRTTKPDDKRPEQR